MTRGEAAELLQLPDVLANPPADQASFEGVVRKAYAEALFVHHPDTGDGCAAYAPELLKTARDTLLSVRIPCTLCGGSGKVRRGWHSATCPYCNGRGTKE